VVALHRADGDVLAYGAAAERLDDLKCAGDAIVGDGPRPLLGNVDAAHQHMAAARPEVACDDVDQGGLAGPVRADDAEHLACGNGKAHIAQRPHAAELARQAADFEDRRRRVCRRGWRDHNLYRLMLSRSEMRRNRQASRKKFTTPWGKKTTTTTMIAPKISWL